MWNLPAVIFVVVVDAVVVLVVVVVDIVVVVVVDVIAEKYWGTNKQILGSEHYCEWKVTLKLG